MSNETPQPEAVEPGHAADASSAGPGAADTPAAGKGSRIPWTGLLALAVALLAAAGVGYLWLEQRSQAVTQDAVGRLTVDLAERTADVARLQAKVEALESAGERADTALGGLDERLASQRLVLDELPLRIGRLENALESVPGVADQARTDWLVTEAAYYMRIANAQLNLARNPGVALRALELADEKLRDLADPRLTRVRAALADEITALRAVPQPDAEGIALRLGSLGRSLDRLPLSIQAPSTFGGGDRETADATGLARAWAAIRAAFASIVRVKRTDETATPLRTPAEESLLLRRVETEVELARLAIVLGQSGLYRDALAGVLTALDRHFDTRDAAVRATRDQLEQLAAAELPAELPDISTSLNLLLALADGAGPR